MLIHIKGAGDIASGVALRLRRAGFDIVMSELERPTSIRREVCFSSAVERTSVNVEGITAILCDRAEDALSVVQRGDIAVIAANRGRVLERLPIDALVDATISKRNEGTHIDDASIVIALGPGFCAGVDCHAVVETMRGHTLGRVYYEGAALPNTGEPGIIGGYTRERVLYAPCAGELVADHSIGDMVNKGDTVAHIGDMPVIAKIPGVVRGLLGSGFFVNDGMKIGDIDPRGIREYCFSVSDKALSIGGGVLEALLSLSRALKGFR